MKRTIIAFALSIVVLAAVSFVVAPEAAMSQASYLYSLFVRNQLMLGDDKITGDNTFTTTALLDTVLITGALATDVYIIQMKDTTATKLTTYTAKAESLVVTRAYGGTSGASYQWYRIRPR